MPQKNVFFTSQSACILLPSLKFEPKYDKPVMHSPDTRPNFSAIPPFTTRCFDIKRHLKYTGINIVSYEGVTRFTSSKKIRLRQVFAEMFLFVGMRT